MSKHRDKNKKKKSDNNRWVKSENTEETTAEQVETIWSVIVKRLLFIFQWIPFFKQNGDVTRSNNIKDNNPSSSKHKSVDEQDQRKKESFDNIAIKPLQQNNEQNKNETQIDATVNSQQNHIAQLIKRNEDLEKQLKHEKEKYEHIKTTKEKLKDDLENNKRALTDKIKEQNDKITSLENECSKCSMKNAELTELSSKLENELKQQADEYKRIVSEKERQIRHSITTSGETIKNLTGQNTKLEKEIVQLKKRISKIETETQQNNTIVSEQHTQIESLMTKNKHFEEEKQDALRRLSAMMSVKLRDNNPNIADLSDQFRPTKLGEQFSELYDNEWTDAFDALQNNFEERHVISILLDIVMESYWFCDQQLVEVWTFAENWFIDKDASTAQQISKTLKDGRKQKVIGRVEDIQQKYTGYLLKVCNTEHLDKLMTSVPLRNYISTCIRLALLMTANDPPVVIECPGWQRFSKRPYPTDTVPHSFPYDGLAPEELNNDKEKKNTSNTIDEPHLIATDTKMNGHDAGKVDNILSNQIKHNDDNMDCTFSTPVQDDGMNPMSNQSVVHKTQTNRSSRLYLEDDVEEQINPADTSKEYGQESNNLSKIESGLDASPDGNFAQRDSIQETLSNEINDTGYQYDVRTVEVRNDTPQLKNGSKDGPVSDISFAESEQHHNVDRHSGGPQEPQNSDADLTKEETSLNDQRIGEQEQTSNNVEHKHKTVLTNYTCNSGTDSSQSHVVNSPTYTDPNRDAVIDIDGICKQIKNLSIEGKENEAYQENETGNAEQGDVVENKTFDTKEGTLEGLSDKESGQHHDAYVHTGGPPVPLNAAAKLTETEGSFNVKRIEDSEKKDNNAMTANKIELTESNVVPDIAQTQAEDSSTGTKSNQDSQTDEYFSITSPDIPVEGTCEEGSGQHQAVEDYTVDDQINYSNILNTKDGSLAGASDVKSGLQQCAERNIDDDQKKGECISETRDDPLEDMSDTVHASGQHQCSIEIAHDFQNPMLSVQQSTTTGVSFNDNRIKKFQQYENDVNGNRTRDATGNSHDWPTEKLKTVERPIFDKDKFKEYTSRGPYVDYFVWPIIYLHRDGPMLGKGIAQGSNDKMADGSNTLLVSWKTMS